MPQRRRCRVVGSTLILVFAALAPGPAQEQIPPNLPNPARARAEAGTKAFDLAWLYYSENRVDADKVYRWSKRSREADLDLAKDKTERLVASETHLTRMLKLEAKIAKIRRLGFGNSLDVVEVEYYRKEAEFWKADAQAR